MARHDDKIEFADIMRREIGRKARWVAGILGLSYSGFMNSLNPDIDKHKLGFFAWVDYLVRTGNRQTLHWVCRRAGGVFVPLVGVPATDGRLERMAFELTRASLEVGGTVFQIIDPDGEDGVDISQNEVRIYDEVSYRMHADACVLTANVHAAAKAPESERRRA